jgi:hypothetical protein
MCFGGPYCLQLQLRMKVVCSSKMLVTSSKAIQHHNPEDDSHIFTTVRLRFHTSYLLCVLIYFFFSLMKLQLLLSATIHYKLTWHHLNSELSRLLWVDFKNLTSIHNIVSIRDLVLKWWLTNLGMWSIYNLATSCVVLSERLRSLVSAFILTVQERHISNYLHAGCCVNTFCSGFLFQCNKLTFIPSKLIWRKNS